MRFEFFVNGEHFSDAYSKDNNLDNEKFMMERMKNTCKLIKVLGSYVYNYPRERTSEILNCPLPEWDDE